MLMLSLVRTLAVLIPSMLNLAIWALARSLNMPEPLVHDGKALCPMRLKRRLRSWFR